jgi:hypothetical protein
MRGKLLTFMAILLAVVGWWGLVELTDQVTPDQPGGLAFFLALLFLALTATLIPPIAYLNRRFAPEATARDRWRFLRHSAWGGLCLSSWAWLQTLRAFNVAFALIIALIFVAIEVLIMRMRSEAS